MLARDGRHCNAADGRGGEAAPRLSGSADRYGRGPPREGDGPAGASGREPAGRRHPAAARTKNATRAPRAADRRSGRSRGSATQRQRQPSDPEHAAEPRSRRRPSQRRTRRERGRKRENAWDTSEEKRNGPPAPRRAHPPPASRGRRGQGCVLAQNRAIFCTHKIERFCAGLDADCHAMATMKEPAAAIGTAVPTAVSAGAVVHARPTPPPTVGLLIPSARIEMHDCASGSPLLSPWTHRPYSVRSPEERMRGVRQLVCLERGERRGEERRSRSCAEELEGRRLAAASVRSAAFVKGVYPQNSESASTSRQSASTCRQCASSSCGDVQRRAGGVTNCRHRTRERTAVVRGVRVDVSNCG